MSYVGRKALDTQTTVFEEVVWATGPALPELINQDVNIHFAPTGLAMPLHLSQSDEAREGRIPHWQFTYRVDAAQGLVVTNAVARGTQRSAADGTLSTERVFSRIDFTDLVVSFTDGSSAPFDVARAMQQPSRVFQFRQNGARTVVDPPDRLMQWGLRLALTDNVLTASGGTCRVELEMVVVFRGATNDFDPGGVPVAMGCLPQLAWRWSADGATKRVAKFRGSVRITCDNVMAGEHVGHGGGNPPAANVAGFYTDSNTAFERNWLVPSAGAPGYVSYQMRAALYGLAAVGAHYLDKPGSWGLLFDYVWSNFGTSKEIVGVYGPRDGRKYDAGHGGTAARQAHYVWPSAGGTSAINTYTIRKTHRQGDYDNIHLHAEMATPDIYGNRQIHAPFCGHSCVHLHWRWSGAAGDGAGDRSWYYKGWSHPASGLPRAHTQPGAPLVPPNQRVKVAICAPQAARFDTDRILNPAALAPLPARNKMIWYCADVFGMPGDDGPPAGQKQVIFEHGLGWAYRYTLRSENATVNDLVAAMATMRWFVGAGPANQQEMAEFFERSVYPNMRYVDWFGTRVQQVPDGTYDRTHVWGSTAAATPVRAEDL